MTGTALATTSDDPAQANAAVTRLRLTDFRCYPSLCLDCDTRSVVLTGPNGAGKTNLLEAISLLTPGRGLRGVRLADMDRRNGPGGWAVAAKVDTAVGSIDIGTGHRPPASRRAVVVNGAAASNQNALAELVSAVWLTPQMDRIFMEGASARRRFLDRLVLSFDPAHAGRTAAYERALRERARLLKSGQWDNAWCNALEETMAAKGVAIAAARQDLTDRLNKVDPAGAFPKAGIAAEGVIEERLRNNPALSVEDFFREQLREGRRLDATTGRTFIGPHRSDLAVHFTEKDMPANQCSTGEQKALLIAIVLAHARLLVRLNGGAPLLLLDEIAAHLDSGRRRALFHEIQTLGAQAWMTGTDEQLFKDILPDVQGYRVSDGQILSQS